jgi:pyridoxamine 5'-phosphate oxidase
MNDTKDPGTFTAEEAQRLRKEYGVAELDVSNISRDPFTQFQEWFSAAVNTGLSEPNAMTLATCDRLGNPSARTVLLKEYDRRGFVFFTNYESRKGKELFENPKGALLFYWAALERQIRVEGAVEVVSREESAAYFSRRPRASQLGAICSRQSSRLESREELEMLMKTFEEKSAGSELVCPAHWGGFRLVPHCFEFWQGRESRLHDRIQYNLEPGRWSVVRLAP